METLIPRLGMALAIGLLVGLERGWRAGKCNCILNAPAPKPIPSAMIVGAIKAVHTVVWAFFVACILAIWVFAWQGAYFYAALSIGVVFIEVLVLLLNGWQCPLTPFAARYTDDRRDNFDIYLPEWLARHTKLIFGTLYVGGISVTLARWAYASA